MIKTASMGMWLVNRFCRVYHKKFIYRVAHRKECDGTYIKTHLLQGKLFKSAIKQADYIFSQNYDDAKFLKQTIGVESAVVPNGHSLPRQEDLTEKNFVLWVGITADFKQPDIFITLAEKFPDEHFVMICQRAAGDNNYDKLLARAAEVRNLEFIQQVDFREIDKYFAKAKILVNTSTSEGFPNTFIQACKAAAAILSLNVNPDGFLDKFSCGICCNGSENKLAESLRFLLAQRKYLQYGKAARDYALQNHDITKIIEIYKDIFRKLTQNKSSAPAGQ